MSTENTEKTEVTITTEDTANDNKQVFGPLGKYAIVAVIMVSVIVTTAFMMNKQLGSVDEQLAAIESEVAQMHGTEPGENVKSTASEATDDVQDTATAETVALAEVQEVEARVDDVQAGEAVLEESQAVETVSASVAAATDNSASKVANNALPSEAPGEVTASEESASETTVAESMPANEDGTATVTAISERDQEREARIEAYRLEQKQYMTEMFARIKSLEAQRLDEYRASQDEEVERLRERITEQEELIETLILRNKEWIEMREASMKRSQSFREEILDRI